MTIKNWLSDATDLLNSSGIQTSRLDSLILLEYILKKERTWILAHPEYEISAPETTKLNNVLAKRAKNVPIAYIRGKSEFYGREFKVNHFVMQPRPESEAFIDLLKALMGEEDISSRLPKRPFLVDVGAGSGAIGTTIALELQNIDVILLELDVNAAKVAKINVDLFTLKIPVIISDLLANAPNKIDIVTANLPYVPDDHIINEAAKKEPKKAIFGGPDGLNIYRRMFNDIENMSHKPLLILIEAFPSQHPKMTEIASKSGYFPHISNGFVQAYTLLN
ncbi:MAG: N5-glutamine methyltransferase family protein [Candidatus Saccharimonadales bacterium]